MEVSYPWFDKNQLSRRGYNYFIELYPDAQNYNCKLVLEQIELEGIAQNSDVKQYAYILHDKDGVKSHYHLAVKYDKQLRVKEFLDRYGLWNYNAGNVDIIVGRSNKKYDRWIACLNYLIHNTKDSIDKYQYSEDEVVSNIPEIINNLRVSQDNIDIFEDIYLYIVNPDNRVSLKSVIEYCRGKDRSYLKTFLERTNNFVFTNLIKERNTIL